MSLYFIMFKLFKNRFEHFNPYQIAATAIVVANEIEFNIPD